MPVFVPFVISRLIPQNECIVSILYVPTLYLITGKTLSLVIPMPLSPRYNPKPEASADQNAVNPKKRSQEFVPYLATLDVRITPLDNI